MVPSAKRLGKISSLLHPSSIVHEISGVLSAWEVDLAETSVEEAVDELLTHFESVDRTLSTERICTEHFAIDLDRAREHKDHIAHAATR